MTNLALRDLIAGLRWVRDEITAFGGDPSDVTLWGQSAGGVNVATLLSSAAVMQERLFHKAVVCSGE